MANAKKNAADTLKALADKVNSIRERDESKTRVAQNERDNVRDTLGRLLAATDDPDAKKKIRRQLRRLGHYISRKGKPWTNATKRTSRKVKPNAGATENAPAADVTENANA